MADDQNLTPANKNPWYVLMTVWGEQDGDKIDWELHKKNRETWNRFWAEEINRRGRAQRDLVIEEISPLDVKERLELNTRLKERGVTIPMLHRYNGHDFRNSCFTVRLICNNFIFPRHTYFQDAEFECEIEFKETVFLGTPLFNEAVFRKSVTFERCSFFGDAFFQEVVFYSDVCFADVSFLGATTFHHVAFLYNADFSRSCFKMSVSFRGAAKADLPAGLTSRTIMDFSGRNYKEIDKDRARSQSNDVGSNKVRNTFFGVLNFNGTMFGAHCDFTNRHFGEDTFFNEARFLTIPPLLSNAGMHPTTDWRLVVWPRKRDWLRSVSVSICGFLASPWFGEEYRPSCYNLNETEQQVDAYAQLRLRMNEIQDHDAELMFFGMEQHAKQQEKWLKKKYAAWLLIAAYGLFSGYGQSVWRPFLTLAGMITAGAFVYRDALASKAEEVEPFLYSLWCSATNTVAFTGLRREAFPDAFEALSLPLQVLAGGQTILGAVFLFLIGLALRNRFRIR